MSGEDKAAVLLVGGGKMGAALLKGWIDRGVCSSVTVVEPNGASWSPSDRVRWVESAENLPAGLDPDIVIFAVKPQMIAGVAPRYGRFADGGAHLLSIAAGKTLAGFGQIFGGNAAITRAMPNTPAAIGEGITVCCANKNVSNVQRNVAGRLLAAVGFVEWVEDETLIDAVTAVSGSGPAYVFLLVETLAAAGIEAGLPRDLALTLARQTVSGTGALLAQSDETPETLRKNVTSPNGTTQAALDVLMAPDGMRPLMAKAVMAALNRSRALAG